VAHLIEGGPYKKGYRTMIEFYLLPGTPLVILDDYNELFNFICGLEGPNKPEDTGWMSRAK